MKTSLNAVKKTVLVLLLTICFGGVQAQDTTSVKSALEAKQFVFKARTMLPAAGGARQLSGENYEVRVSGDSLVTYLPYFGRAYTAPIGNEGGLKFTSTTFDYVVKGKRKGGWDVTLRPKDATDVRELSLSVSENGFASLRALSNNRQPISFNGTVTAAAKKQ